MTSVDNMRWDWYAKIDGARERTAACNILWFLLFLSATTCQSALAFDGKRHQLICNKVWVAAPTSIRKKIKALLSTSSYRRFDIGCRWPDLLRRQYFKRHTQAWHYLNVPIASKTVAGKQCVKQQCVTQQLLRHWLILERQPDWQSLLFVAHLLVDLHQPLHISYRFDRGGNTTWVSLPKSITSASDNRMSLHHYWDNHLLDLPTLESAIESSFNDPLPLFDTELLPAKKPSTELQKLTLINQWADESLAITRSIYRLPRNDQTLTISAQQHKQWREVLIRRLQAAEKRLLWLLSITLLATQKE